MKSKFLRTRKSAINRVRTMMDGNGPPPYADAFQQLQSAQQELVQENVDATIAHIENAITILEQGENKARLEYEEEYGDDDGRTNMRGEEPRNTYTRMYEQVYSITGYNNALSSVVDERKSGIEILRAIKRDLEEYQR